MNDESVKMPTDGYIGAAETSIYCESNMAQFKDYIYSHELWQRPLWLS